MIKKILIFLLWIVGFPFALIFGFPTYLIVLTEKECFRREKACITYLIRFIVYIFLLIFGLVMNAFVVPLAMIFVIVSLIKKLILPILDKRKAREIMRRRNG